MSNPTTYAPQIVALAPHESTMDAVRAAVIELQTYVRAREPEHEGEALDKVITWRDAVNAGLAKYSLGTPGGGGPGGGEFEPPPTDGLAGWDDLTPPDPLAGLTVTSIPTGFFVEFDAPTYRQGGGNAYSIIYQANYSGAGPLPTFSLAVPVGTVNERNVILVIPAEPGVQGHFWAQPVSHAEDYNHIAPQTTPTGGLHGVSTIAGQLSDDHIATLSVGKLIAGELQVGEYLQSTGYDPGVYGFRLNGDGTCDFRAGLIGGAVIDADGIESTNYVGNVSGWRLDNTTGNLYANAVVLHPDDYTDNAKDLTTTVSETWPAATNPWEAFPFTAAAPAGASHQYKGGILTITADAQLVATFDDVGSGVVAAKAIISLVKKDTSGSGSYGVVRQAVVYAKTVTIGSDLICTFNVALGTQYDREQILAGTYYWGVYVNGCETFNAAGATVSAGSGSTLTGQVFIDMTENHL